MSPFRSSWRGVMVAVVTISIVFTAFPAAATTLIQNLMSAHFDTPGVDGPLVHHYGSGTPHLFATDADFSSGTLTGSATITGDAIELTATVPDDWWDQIWTHRQCFDVTADTTIASTTIHLAVDTTAAATDDLRVVATDTSTTPASHTIVDHYLDGGIGTDFTSIWINQPVGPTTITYCVYFASVPTQPSTGLAAEADLFAYGGQPVTYYQLTDAYDGSNGINGRIDVVSYIDGNTVTHGATTVTLDTGDIHTFRQVDENSVFTATGPIEGSYDRANKPELVPESHAASRFTFPTSRATQTFWVRSPHAATTVQAWANGAVIATLAISPVDGSVELTAEAAANGYVTLRSVDGTDFLAAHQTTADADFFSGLPVYGDRLYGVGSRFARFGADTATNVTVDDQTGATHPISVTTTTPAVLGTFPAQGDGTAMVVTPAAGPGPAAAPVAVIQQADSDGVEATAFLPQRLLGRTFHLPIRSQYVTVACPVVGTTVTFNGTARTCSGTGIGGVRELANQAAGVTVTADHPVFVYYEGRTSNDETNLWGFKGFRPYVDGLASTAGPVEALPTTACAQWTSPTVSIGGVVGLSWFDATLSPAATVDYHLSFDGGPFTGPDGTTATSYHDEGPTGPITTTIPGLATGTSWLPFSADGSTTAAIQLSVCGTPGNQVNTIGFESDLAQVVSGDTVSASGDPGFAALLLRSYPASATGTQWVDHLTSTGQTDFRLRVDAPGLPDDGTQIEAASGTVTNPAPPFSPQATNIILDQVSAQNATVDFTIIHAEAVRFETTLGLTISAP